MGILTWLGHCCCGPSDKAKKEVFANSTPNLDAIAAGIKSGRFKNIIVLTGAGISVSAGIPDFRSRTGMYEMSQRFSLPNPWAVFDIGFFHQTALPFYYIVRKMVIGPDGNYATYYPTPTHLFFKLLEKKGKLLRVYTQNVDCLERAAGLSTSKLVQMHGHFSGARCAVCKEKAPVSYIAECMKGEPASSTNHILNGSTEYKTDDGQTVWRVPTCPNCHKGVVKPDVVLFNEGISAGNVASAAVDFPRCDLLLCFGSTFKVMPFANFIGAVDDLTPRVLFNMEMVGRAEDDGPLRSNKVCFRFTEPTNYRDLFVEGECDKNVRILCEKLGWVDELEEMMQEVEACKASRQGRAGDRADDVGPASHSTTTGAASPPFRYMSIDTLQMMQDGKKDAFK